MADAFAITIYHNPDCGTSLNTLAMIRAAGYEPLVVEYLNTGWSRDLIEPLLRDTGMTVRELMREKGTPAAELGLLNEGTSEAAIIDAMLAHPILVNRPIVATPKGVKLWRPSEVVLPLLDSQPERFVNEDGQIVLSWGARLHSYKQSLSGLPAPDE